MATIMPFRAVELLFHHHKARLGFGCEATILSMLIVDRIPVLRLYCWWYTCATASKCCECAINHIYSTEGGGSSSAGPQHHVDRWPVLVQHLPVVRYFGAGGGREWAKWVEEREDQARRGLKMAVASPLPSRLDPPLSVH